MKINQTMYYSGLLIGILLVLSISISNSEKQPFDGIDFSNVLTLTDENYTKFTNDKENPLFLLIYASWCGHCHHFMPIFAKAADKAKEDGIKITFARIDGDINNNLSKEFKVEGFPTIYLINNGEKTEYEGERSIKDVLKFIKDIIKEEKREEKKEEKKEEKIMNEKEAFSDVNFTNVLTLTDENYTKYITDKSHPLILFIYSLSDEKCVEFMPIYAETADYSERIEFNISFAKINGPNNKKIVDEYNIQNYPKIYIFYEDEKIEYKDEYDLDSLVQTIDLTINKRIKDIGSVEEIEEMKKNLTDTELIILSTLIEKNKLLEEGLKLFSEDERFFYTFLKCISKGCLEKYPKNDIILLKSFNEEINTLSQFKKEVIKQEEEDYFTYLRKFVGYYGFEDGAILNEININMIFSYNKSVIYYIRDSSDKVQTSYDNIFKSIGKKLKKKNIYSVLADIKGSDLFEQTGEFFSILDSELPCLLFYKIKYPIEEKPKFYKIPNLKKENINEENIFKFIDDIYSNKILNDLHSGSIPTENLESSYKIIVGKTYDEYITNEKNKNIFLAIMHTDDKCEICTSFFNVFETLSKKFKNNKEANIKFAVLDGLENEARNFEWEENDLPLIYLLANNKKEKKVIKFEPKEENKYDEGELNDFIMNNLEIKNPSPNSEL